MSKTALITGANRGIGLAIAKGLTTQGYKVLMGCRDTIGAQREAEKINATLVELNLSKPEVLKKNLNNILTGFPQIDVLVNNAAILVEGSIMNVSPDNFYASMQVNFEAPYEMTRIVAKQMIKFGFGRIVNLSSGWGAFSSGLNGPGAYSISKAALNALTVSFSQVFPNNIKINSMCPGWVRTRMGGPTATRSPEKGAETAIWLATLDKDGPSGGFFRDKKPIAW